MVRASCSMLHFPTTESTCHTAPTFFYVHKPFPSLAARHGLTCQAEAWNGKLVASCRKAYVQNQPGHVQCQTGAQSVRACRLTKYYLVPHSATLPCLVASMRDLNHHLLHRFWLMAAGVLCNPAANLQASLFTL